MMQKRKNGLSVIVPVYNEEKIIEENAKRLEIYLAREKVFFEIILSNNASKDKTLEKAEKLAKESKNIATANTKIKGIGAGLKNGFAQTKFENIAFYPIDLSYDFAFFSTASALLDRGTADIVVGSKRKQKETTKRPLQRKILSFFFNQLINFFFRLEISDVGGTIAFKKSTAGKTFESVEANDSFFAPEFLIKAKKAGLKIVETPVAMTEYRKDSKISPIIDSIRILWKLAKMKLSGY
jgi:glycosyltransferase involved in cell wall biosynthesis